MAKFLLFRILAFMGILLLPLLGTAQHIDYLSSIRELPPLESLQAGSRTYATSLANIGDLNGDGMDEMAVGMVDSIEKGQIAILFFNGRHEVESVQIIGDQMGGFTGELTVGDRFGEFVEVIGDVDGNQVNDLVVSATTDVGKIPAIGAVWVLLLHPNGTVKAQHKIKPYLHDSWKGSLGHFLCGFVIELGAEGDLNGDHIPDFYTIDGMERRWEIYLRKDGSFLSDSLIESPVRNYNREIGGHNWRGFYLKSMGDLNQDGIRDVAICENAFDNRQPLWICTLSESGAIQSKYKVDFEREVGKYFRDEIYKTWSQASIISLGKRTSPGGGSIAIGDFMHQSSSLDMNGTIWFLEVSPTKNEFAQNAQPPIEDPGSPDFGMFTQDPLEMVAVPAFELTVYPNPCREVLNYTLIRNGRPETDISIFNATGQIVKTLKGVPQASGKGSIDMSSLSTGIYFLRVISEEGLAVKMIVKQ